jgi:hypothetical protein
VLSHQILFFIFAADSGCREKLGRNVDIGSLIAEFAAAMYAEQQMDTEFSDLMAERMGLGAFVGYREFLKDDLIKTIIKAQKDSGCWWRSTNEPGCSAHPTGMAAWVLALWLMDRGLI